MAGSYLTARAAYPVPRRAASTEPASPCTGRGLASRRVTTALVGSYPTVSPLPPTRAGGGLLSVPLSIGFRRLGFPQRPALRCPDFPRACRRSSTPAVTRPARLRVAWVPPSGSRRPDAKLPKVKGVARWLASGSSPSRNAIASSRAGLGPSSGTCAVPRAEAHPTLRRTGFKPLLRWFAPVALRTLVGR